MPAPRMIRSAFGRRGPARLTWTASGTLAAVASLSIAVPSAATAAPSAPAAHSAGAVPARTNYTCTFWRAELGPWQVTKAVRASGLVWTADGSSNKNWVRLAPFRDKLTQCTKMQNFGYGQFELMQAHGPFCVSVANGSKRPGANILLSPCLSKWSQRWTEYQFRSGLTVYRNVNSGLCITAPAGLRSGSALRQESCGNFNNLQTFERINP